ncbi:MAG: glycosyltransferase family 2 protein [Clostridia bacterium]|nr:glycosyltransferase family 2 protein [Clostridia bacterium]
MPWLYITWIPGLLISLFLSWFALLALFAVKRRPPYFPAPPQTRFAVVIAARNEEQVIGNLVASLLKQDYPHELFDVFVVPNNCTDRTAQAALEAGAYILPPTAPVLSKGDALGQVLPSLCQKPYHYDAFCFFDADNVVDSHFLAEMNRAFCAGARVAKGRNEAKNPYDSWVSGCYATYFGLINLFYNRARANVGLSAKLVGTGMAVSRQCLEDLGGWNTQTITEDADLAAQCAAAGEQVFWVPNAVTYDEEPNSFRLSLTQRCRWTSGIMQVAGIRLASLLKGKKEHFWLRFDAVMNLLAPFLQALSPLLSVFSLLLHACLIPTLLPSAVLAGLTGLALSYLGGMVGALTVTCLCGRKVRRMWKGIIGFPIFLASWMGINVYSLFRKTTVWKEIHHCRNLSAEELPCLRNTG